jgi:hypothetical protein
MVSSLTRIFFRAVPNVDPFRSEFPLELFRLTEPRRGRMLPNNSATQSLMFLTFT